MYWISPASNRAAIAKTLEDWFEGQQDSISGGLWMTHSYTKQASFDGNETKLVTYAWPMIVNQVKSMAGGNEASPGKLTLLNGTYHIVNCNSPEYRCYPPFESKACSTKQDCNYDISQLRWGLKTALNMSVKYGLEKILVQNGVNASWWQELLDTKLAWYPYDNITGFRLDTNCAFECPHRHFSHLLQMFDLETVGYNNEPPVSDQQEFLNTLIHKSLDNWYSITCNESNWFNEECRGFTQCGMTAMNAISDRLVNSKVCKLTCD